MAKTSKGMEDNKDNPLLFSGDPNDWASFKQDIQAYADKHDTTWLFEGGRALALFYARQIKDKTGSKKSRAEALARETADVKDDSNHVPASPDAYTDEALKDWFDSRDTATDLQLSLNKNRFANLGSNFCDFAKLGYKDQGQLDKAHKAVDLKYLRQMNRSAVRLLHDAVFEHPQKETPARTKLHSVLKNNEVSKVLKGAIDDDDATWLTQPWEIPAVQIWGKICHKYEGMTDMLSGTMMEELANIITCVTGDARQRRTIYQADQDFERFGKTLTANFKDTATLWDFLRASLRQCHIRKLAKVGKDKTAWAKADEYLTNLMDSDTMLTLDNTDDAIKRAENYIQRQDKDDDKRVAFSSTQDGEPAGGTEDVQDRKSVV